MRSLMPKIDNVAKDMEDRMCGIIFLTEIWEKSKSKRHQYKIEELFEMKGIKYISTARVDRVGGGAAIAANSELFSLDKLENIVVPKNQLFLRKGPRERNLTDINLFVLGL